MKVLQGRGYFQLLFFYIFIRASAMLYFVIHISSCGYSDYWSNPSSPCFKALSILVLQVGQVLQVVVGATGMLAVDSRMPGRR